MSGMDVDAVRTAYGRWARTYDHTFGLLFGGARRRAIELLGLRPGDRAIEVGVGTGLSLPLLPDEARVVGVDFSREMLRRAQGKKEAVAGRLVAMLVEADGARLPFADSTFDAALAPFVVSAAPHPVRLLHDVVRVCKPGATIVVLNHFSPRNPVLAALERGASALTSRLFGFHADFPLEPLFERAGLRPERIERATRLGSWYIVTLTRKGGA